MIVFAALLLGACESVKLHKDFDPQRDFSHYRSWSWNSPRLQYKPNDPRLKSDLTEQRVAEAVAEQLLQRGLRPAPAGRGADLKVSAWIIVDRRFEQSGSGYTPLWGGYWGGYWAPGPAYAESRVVEYKVGTLQIDLYDAQDGKLVWRGSAEQIMRTDPPTPAERSAIIRETVAKVLSQYPPR